MRNQIKFTFQIGYATRHRGFEGAIIAAASRLCGGCTSETKTGWWMSDGASHADTFKGSLEQEHCFDLELTCEMAKAEDVYGAMCQHIARLALAYKVDTNWVHVSEVAMTGRHFSIDAINAERVAA